MADQTLAKFVNELRILTMLRTQGQTTRANIARRLKLTPATITRLINSLEERGLVRDVQIEKLPGPAREPGRPGVGVVLNSEGAYFLGVEMGVGVLRFALVDLRVDVVDAAEFHVMESITPPQVVKMIVKHLALLERDTRFHGKIGGLGVTVPGLVNSGGHIVHLPVLGWKDVNLLGLIKGAVQVPVFVENNANAAAFSSVYAEPMLGGSCAIYLKLGTGCGGAAIVNGRLLRGAGGMAGEFGHIRIADQGSKCYCGQQGCLETFVNLRALARFYCGTDSLTETEFAALPADVAAKASAGDVKAAQALDELCLYLSMGIISMVNTFNPATVTLGGTMRPAIEGYMAHIQRRVADAIVPGMTVPEIRMSGHGNMECAVGAAAIAHHHTFDVSWNEMTSGRDGE
jgi:predicted NBD/HSP70 family sugar kinase